MHKALFIMNPKLVDVVYPPDLRDQIGGLVEIIAPPLSAESLADDNAVLAECELLFSGWGGPRVDADFLAAAPKLQAIFYGAGTIKPIVTPEMWARGIIITQAADANALVVAHYTLAQIILCLKGVWLAERETRRQRTFPGHQPFPGLAGSTVGIIALGLIGQHVCRLLAPLGCRLLAYDPYVSAETAAALGVERVSLEFMFDQADVVSLHAPWLPETEGMITGALLRRLKPYASFINTARGALVREDELIAVLDERPDVCAVLDVTYPEPPPPDSPLYTLPNVVLTPHTAGATNARDVRQLGETMLAELKRYLNGDPLRWQVTAERLATMA